MGYKFAETSISTSSTSEPCDDEVFDCDSDSDSDRAIVEALAVEENEVVRPDDPTVSFNDAKCSNHRCAET